MPIKIRIKDGRVYADFVGYAGDSCEIDARKLLQALSKFESEVNVRRKSGSEETGVTA